MSDETYNGWTNYETWCMALWIDNEEGSYDYARYLAEDIERDEDGTSSVVLADRLQSWQDDERPDQDTASVFTDLLGAALGRVDWYAIARVILSENVDA